MFLKAPQPGKVKTRLAAVIGPRRAADLYRAFVVDTLSWVTRFPIATQRVDFSPISESARCKELLPPGTSCELHPQVDGDLGQRMEGAFRSMFDSQHKRCVIIGTDCPMLTPRIVRTAFKTLEQDDVVLGPTEDGGYYLIGLRKPAPTLLRNMKWSTDRVCSTTCRRAHAAGLRTTLLPKLADVDVVADLPQLYSELLSRWSDFGGTFPTETFRYLEWQLHARTAPKSRRSVGATEAAIALGR